MSLLLVVIIVRTDIFEKTSPEEKVFQLSPTCKTVNMGGIFVGIDLSSLEGDNLRRSFFGCGNSSPSEVLGCSFLGLWRLLQS
jgi:hypothetical protein